MLGPPCFYWFSRLERLWYCPDMKSAREAQLSYIRRQAEGLRKAYYHDLRTLDTKTALDNLRAMFELAASKPARPDSGLVIMQTIFGRAKNV